MLSFCFLLERSCNINSPPQESIHYSDCDSDEASWRLKMESVQVKKQGGKNVHARMFPVHSIYTNMYSCGFSDATQTHTALLSPTNTANYTESLAWMMASGGLLPPLLPYSFSGKSFALAWLHRSVIFGAELVLTTTLRRRREGGRRKFRGNECWELLLDWTPHSFFFSFFFTAIRLTFWRETFWGERQDRKSWKNTGNRSGARTRRNRRVRTLKPPWLCVIEQEWLRHSSLAWVGWMWCRCWLPNEGRLGHTLLWPHTESALILDL